MRRQQSGRTRARSTAEAGIAACRCVATNAVRESANAADLIDGVRKEAGLQHDAMSGSDEARPISVAVRQAADLAGRDWIVAAVGGGSVEELLADRGAILWSESHTMGFVRLLEELSGAREEPGRIRRRLEEYTATLRLPAAASRFP